MILLAIVVDVQTPAASFTMTEGIVLFLIGTVIQVLFSWATNKANAAEWKGAANEKFVNIETKFDEIDEDQSRQWKDINKANNGVSKLDGQMSRINPDLRPDIRRR